eukprot:CAMPEP_0194550054 /NCGR_PEP_ID=MMETSP0253-20130528/95518_1 /TAXON_ID=2966 /ORGANISM="Noctiluca scintillans" /LENGTH=516 /DNA_ID=CAMNT_0039397489 /DNA_START=86 /DNA_END=1637 /DNA_ORIENTATION=-
MFIPASTGAALAVALASMVCWGSWSNFLVLTGDRMRFELFYLDFSFGVFFTAVVAAFVLGNIPSDGHNGDMTFFDDFRGIPADRYIFAALAGTVFNVANLALCKGIAMLGLALAFPLCIGTAMVLGTVLSYVLKPSGNPLLLFIGVFVAFCAVCAAAVMHYFKEQQQSAARKVSLADNQSREEPLFGHGEPSSLSEPSMTRKLVVCIAGGILMSLWNPLVVLATNDPGLSPYGEFVFYSAAVTVTSLFLVPLIIAFPLEGGQGDSPGAVLSKWSTPRACATSTVLLFIGVFVAFCAVCAAAVMHYFKEQQQSAAREVSLADNISKEEPLSGEGEPASFRVAGDSGTPSEPSMTRKLVVCIVGGILMGLWNPLVVLATNDPGLSPYGEFVFYSAAIAVTSLFLVPLIIAFPLEGGQGDSPGAVLSKWSSTPCVCHVYSFLGGFVWAFGTLFNAMAGNSKKLSSAESYAIGQCAGVAAIFWGIFLFAEFKGTDMKVKGLIVLVLALYVVAIAFITMAS